MSLFLLKGNEPGLNYYDCEVVTMLEQFDGILDKVEGAVGEGGLGDLIGGGNVLLDPAPEVNSVLSAIFAFMVEAIAFLSNLVKF